MIEVLLLYLAIYLVCLGGVGLLKLSDYLFYRRIERKNERRFGCYRPIKGGVWGKKRSTKKR
ncbi:hypothetical protein ES702_01741 [subsurface metagenome]